MEFVLDHLSGILNFEVGSRSLENCARVTCEISCILKLGCNIMKGTECFVSLYMSVVLTE